MFYQSESRPHDSRVLNHFEFCWFAKQVLDNSPIGQIFLNFHAVPSQLSKHSFWILRNIVNAIEYLFQIKIETAIQVQIQEVSVWNWRLHVHIYARHCREGQGWPFWYVEKYHCDGPDGWDDLCPIVHDSKESNDIFCILEEPIIFTTDVSAASPWETTILQWQLRVIWRESLKLGQKGGGIDVWTNFACAQIKCACTKSKCAYSLTCTPGHVFCLGIISRKTSWDRRVCHFYCAKIPSA